MPVTLVSGFASPTPAQATQVPLVLWACTAFYQRDHGRRQQPTCGPFGTPSRINRVHGGKAKKIIRWLAVGWGGYPPLPSWDTQCANEVLEYDEIGQPATGLWLDGTPVVAVAGEYRYMLQVCPALSDTLTFCAAPYQSNPSVSVFQLTPAQFSSLFVAPSTPPAGAGGLISLG
ncbi:MAG TPA: hypothetical protein VMS17_13330 [Gemmataceae bacterium]|nr:hypothetical protein [Gemmataceae bacterium]